MYSISPCFFGTKKQYITYCYYIRHRIVCQVSYFAVKCVLQAIWSDLATLDCGPSSAAIVDVPQHAEKANFFGLSKTALLRHARALY